METMTWGCQCHFVCLHVWIIYLVWIRPIKTIKTIIRLKSKTTKWTPSFIINSLTNTFHKAELFRMFKILKTLIMTWAFEEYCLEINVILIQYIWVFDFAVEPR